METRRNGRDGNIHQLKHLLEMQRMQSHPDRKRSASIFSLFVPSVKTKHGNVSYCYVNDWTVTNEAAEEINRVTINCVIVR